MKKWRNLLYISVLSVSLAACGDSAAPVTTGNASNTGAITITDAAETVHSFNEPPASIAALSVGDMDILMALGANVTGRPTISYDVADEILEIQEIGNPHEPSIEQIVKVGADVLIAPTSFKPFASTVESTGTQIMYQEANSIQQIQETISDYGTLLQKEQQALALNEDISTAVTNAQDHATDVKALLIYGAPGTYLTALNSSLSGDILTKAGGYNVANDFPVSDNYPNYANLSVEKIVQAEPDVVMILTHASPEAVVAGFKQQMETSSGWKNLQAVKEDRIYVLPADLFGNNPGTRIIDALEFMTQKLEEVSQQLKK